LQNGHDLDIRSQGNQEPDGHPDGVSDAWADAINPICDLRSIATLLQETGHIESDTPTNRDSYRGNYCADTVTPADAWSIGNTKTIISPDGLSNNRGPNDFAHNENSDIAPLGCSDEESNARANEESDEVSNRVANQASNPKPNNALPNGAANNEVSHEGAHARANTRADFAANEASDNAAIEGSDASSADEGTDA
jgi:hypothetical protein